MKKAQALGLQRWQSKHGSFNSQIHYPFHEVSNANTKNGRPERQNNTVGMNSYWVKKDRHGF
jgi:hypothetical protein